MVLEHLILMLLHHLHLRLYFLENQDHLDFLEEEILEVYYLHLLLVVDLYQLLHHHLIHLHILYIHLDYHHQLLHHLLMLCLKKLNLIQVLHYKVLM
uniref:Uncharacterized protein n=1 Tax=uncultured marine virus TaxID=186617 RepID=A0A0F7L7P5_9VIRU|nr:hypothetical protein [uncultured marine virus]